MYRLSLRQIWKSIFRRTRTLLNAFLAASLLLGLIPPPLVSHTADLTGFENLSGLAEALPEPAAAAGAPAHTAAMADLREPPRLNLSASEPNGLKAVEPAAALAPQPQTTTCGTSVNDLGGTVFRDFDSDGTQDADEPAFDGTSGPIIVSAFDNNGQVGAPISVGTDGTYNFDDIFNGRTGDDAHIRLEFSGLPSWAQSGVQGTNSGTTVQRHSAATCAADLAVQNPTDFCQADPPLTVACYLQPLDATATAWTDEPAIVQIPYESGTTATDTSAINTVEDEAFKTILATNGEVGSVFGLAFDQGEGTIYTSAFMKRHVPYGPAGVDAIYKIDGTGVSTFANLNALVGGTPAGTDEHSPNGNNYQEDDVWDAVGKSSFADLAISQDGSTLYVVTLTDSDRQLYKISVPADGSNPLAANVQSFALPSPADCPAHPSTGGGELNHNLRPGALEYSDGTLYVGLTCTAESTQATGDLKGYVYAFDPANDTFASTPLLTIPFNYSRTNVTSNPVVAPGAFNPWTTVQMTFATSPALNGRDDNASYPMPWLMDIGFADDGCMVLGIADRFGHLSSGRNSPPEQLNGNAGGDILKACNLAGSWTLENNGNDGVNPATAGAGTNAGPGNGEFFHDEAFDMVSDTYHTEISNGAFAILRGKEEVVLGVYDPAPRPGTLPNGATAFDSGGLAYLSTVDGSRTRSYMLFNRLENGGETGNGFDKASATGDIVAFCDAAPLEIGNYVWLDEDGDGIQDPCEEPIPGVTVELLDAGGTSLATATTDANGEYYFVDATDPRLAAGGVYETVPISVGVATSLTPSSTYQIRIDTTQAAVSAYELTTTDANSGSTLPDGVDSDATESGGFAIIDIVTPDAGHNDHTFDFGFKPSSVRIGNRVWYDANDNGVIDGFENSYGVDGVTVELLQGGTVISTTTTANGGFYLFTKDNTGAALTDGDYQVRIPATNNMGAAGSALPLDDWRSSTDTADAGDPNTDVDSDDNGSGTTDGADITSGTVSVAAGTEPTQTVDTDDANGNLTVDFGFYDVCSTADGDLGGNVFRDFNSDGILDTNEPGWLDGITVTAYDNDGNATTTTINPDGSYDFDAIFPNPVTDVDHIRLEFSGLPDWATSGVAGSNSGTTVQHHKAASCAADLAVHNPGDYCESNPDVATSCFVNGDGSGNGGTPLEALVTVAYDARLPMADLATNVDTRPTITKQADTAEIGPTWGLAHQASSDTLFAASFYRGHTGIGPEGMDAIYLIDPTINSVTGHFNLSDFGAYSGSLTDTRTYTIPANPLETFEDPLLLSLAGKSGLGDLDISADGNTLAVVNLHDRTLVQIDITDPLNPSLLGAPIAIPNPGCTATPPSYQVNMGEFTDSALPAGTIAGWEDGLNSAYTNNSYTSMILQRFGLQNLTVAGPYTNGTDAPDAVVETMFYDDTNDLNMRFPVMDTRAYNVELYFLSDAATDDFDIQLEGTTVQAGYLPAANVADKLTFTVTPTDNILNINLIRNSGRALVNAIKITPVDASSTTTGTNDDVRPFAATYHDGDLYVGLVCSAQHSQNPVDSDAHIMRLNGTTLTSIYKMALDYERGLGRIYNNVFDDRGYFGAKWNGWQDEFFLTAPRNNVSETAAHYPQPILSDIEFDTDGSMILAFLDRVGVQIGAGYFEIPGQSFPNVVNPLIDGDMVRVCNVGGTFVLEGDAGCTQNFAPSADVTGPGANGGEYYDDSGPADYKETNIGGLAVHPTRGHLLHNALWHPADGLTGSLGSHRIIWLEQDDGSQEAHAELLDSNSGATGAHPAGDLLAKGIGLGDLELICDAAPLEIGNYVWLDDDGDGIQDPCEDPIPGVTVTLHNRAGRQIASAETDANGEYYFIGSSDPRLEVGGIYETVPISVGVIGNLRPNTDYEIHVETTQSALLAYELTIANATVISTTLPDSIDSDGLLQGTTAVIKLTTGDAGSNDHTFDFGFKPETPVVGNRVWYDANDNGTIDGFEDSYGIDGVTVELLDNGGAVISTTTTANGGYYLFTRDDTGTLLTDNDYQVRIPATNNMGAAGSALPLDDWGSSTDTADAGDPNTDIDSDDNGSGTTAGADITSGTISLAVGTEPTQTVDTDGANGNLTVDFGFYDVCDTGAGDLGGNIFRDFNSDGVLDSAEPGWLAGITVTAYDNDGNAVTTTINPDGSYDFDGIFPTPVTDADHIRLEFSGLPDWATSGTAGSNSGTTVQHHKAASCGADLAVQNPADYCQVNPDLTTTCFLDNTGDGKALVSWPYEQRGLTPEPDGEALYSQIGSTWGVAYDRTNERIFTSAFLKRHAPLPDADNNNQGDLGAIYQISADANSANDGTPLWLNLDGATDSGGNPIEVGTIDDNATRGITAVPGTPSTDADAFDKVGKVGIGDIDISDDQSVLWAVNLYQKTLHGIQLNSDGSAGTINTYTLPDPCNANPADNAGDPYDDTDMRPFGLEYHDGDLYVGLVCSAEYSAVDADMSAHIYRFDDGTGTFDAAPILSFALNYEKSFAANHGDCNVTQLKWFPWTSAWPDSCGFNGRIVYAQPILSGIEFTSDGNLVVGMMDRMGHQGGELNADPTGNMDNGDSTIGFRVNSSGDILRATSNHDGTYTIETTWTDNAAETEFFSGDLQIESNGFPNHAETGYGALAYLTGAPQIVATAYNPLHKADGGTFNEAGVIFSQIADGSRALTGQGYLVYENTSTITGTFAKAAGLGDLVLICDAAPLEIGNYVWLDDDGDGIQDPCEDPIPGVTVTLYDITGTQVASAVTDNSGEYYFVDATDPRLAAGGVYETVPISVGVATSLVASTTYQIRIDTTQAAVSAYDLTVTDANSGSTLPDGVDSDATQSGDYAIIDIVTPEAGHNDHTFDFGFVSTASLALEKTLVSPANGIAMVGDTMTFQLQITNTGSVTVTELNLVDRYDPAILQYISALIAPDSQVAGTITWASVDGDGSSLDGNLPLAPGVSFIITVDFEVIGVTRP